MQVLLLDNQVAMAAAGRLTVLSINATLTVDLLDVIWLSSVDHRQRYGQAALSLTVMRPDVSLPDEAARAYIKVLHLRGDAALTAVVVIDTDGFRAAALRGVLASMSLLSRHAPRAAASVGEALEQLAGKLDAETGSPAVLGPWIEDFRARHLAL